MNLSFNYHNIKLSELLTTQFWFAIDRSTLHFSDKLFLLIGAVLVVFAIALFVYAKLIPNKFLGKFAAHTAKIFLTIGILEAFWFGLRYQYAQVLGTRFTATLILLIGVIWMYWPVKYLFSNYKEDVAKAEREASREKYLNRK